MVAGACHAKGIAHGLLALGAHLLAVGHSEERARLLGVSVVGVRLAAYAVCGALAGAAATFYVGNYRNVEMTVGGAVALDAIAAVVLGGTSVLGGKASLVGTALGVVLIRVLQNGLTIVGLPALWQPVVTGALLIAALAVERFASGPQLATEAT